MNHKELLIIFAKWPEKGKVKSRLNRLLDEAFVAELYRCFVEDLLGTVRKTGCRTCIAFDPAGARDNFISWLGKDHEYMPQQGNDIGQKMENAFLSAFAGGPERVVLIGSDFPDLPSDIIRLAFDSLRNNGAVIGPAEDGGYYLIGFEKKYFLPSIFKNMPWSTYEVFQKTRSVFNENGCAVYQLPLWHDIDRPEDLSDFVSRNSRTGFAGSQTMKLLRSAKISAASYNTS